MNFGISTGIEQIVKDTEELSKNYTYLLKFL